MNNSSTDITSDDIRSICYEPFGDPADTTFLPCTHKFHADCIIPALNTNSRCPICRLSIHATFDNDGNVVNPTAEADQSMLDPVHITIFADENDNPSDIFAAMRQVFATIRAEHGMPV